MKGITRRQRAILDYIHNFITENKYSPSYREIMKHFGFSSLGTVYTHMKTLQAKGLIEKEKHAKRSVIPQKENAALYSQSIKIPLIGKVRACYPIEMHPFPSEIEVPANLVGNTQRTYALTACGNGFNDELIGEGDIIVLEAISNAAEGNTVLAAINQFETLIKKIYYEDNYIRLEGHTPHHQPMIIRAQDLIIHGVIAALLRNY